MNGTRPILKSLSKFGLVLLLIIFILIFQNIITDQDELINAGEKLNSNKIEIVPLTVRLTDTPKYDKNQNGILNKIIHSKKFIALC